MKLINRLIKTSTLALFALYSCSLETVNLKNNSAEKINIYKDKNLSIKGIAQFDSFKVKSQLDISTSATISLIYPPNHNDISLRDTTVATGLTDIQGNFLINTDQRFIPELGKVMILEASKRIGGAGNTSVSLRTNIKWNGQKWESISSPGLFINKKTTAISIISALDSNTMTSLESLNRLVYLHGVGNVIFNQKLTISKYNTVYKLVESLISDLRDPVEEIINLRPYNGLVNTVSLSPSIKSNMHTYQTMLETYAVDWGGTYPDTAENLDQEAKNKNYFSNFKNPFSVYDYISDYFPAIINISDYQQAKSTLNYKYYTLRDKSQLKGIVVYWPLKINNEITRYFIYGVNEKGDFLNTDDTTSETFVLTNQ